MPGITKAESAAESLSRVIDDRNAKGYIKNDCHTYAQAIIAGALAIAAAIRTLKTEE